MTFCHRMDRALCLSRKADAAAVKLRSPVLSSLNISLTCSSSSTCFGCSSTRFSIALKAGLDFLMPGLRLASALPA
nr:unnamed protein product [Callosobruchus chinensis]